MDMSHDLASLHSSDGSHTVSLSHNTRNLPDELLQKIFGHVINGEAIDLGIRDGNMWKLQKVCVRWKNIVQDTPPLWSSFQILKTEIDHATTYNRLQSCLKFSKTSPLTVILYPQATTLTIHHSQALIDIVKHADRIISFKVRANVVVDMTANIFVQGCIHRQGLAYLRQLEIYWHGRGRRSVCPLSVFQSASVLEEAVLGRISLTDFEAFPWSRLKKLALVYTYTGESTDDMLSVLKSMTSLEELTLMMDAEDEGPLRTEVVTLPLLHKLYVVNSHFSPIWTMLLVPALTEVRIQNDFDEEDAGILDMLQKSACSIKRLALCTGAILYLQQFHAVEELRIFPYDMDDLQDILSSLVRPDGQDTKNFPYLKKITVNFTGHPSIFRKSLEQIMISRARLTEDSHQAALTFLKCISDDIYHYHHYPNSESYVSELNELKKLGDKLGIEVEMDFKSRAVEIQKLADNDGKLKSTKGSGRGIAKPRSSEKLWLTW